MDAAGAGKTRGGRRQPVPFAALGGRGDCAAGLVDQLRPPLGFVGMEFQEPLGELIMTIRFP